MLLSVLQPVLQQVAAGCAAGGQFFGFPYWYKYLVIAGRMQNNPAGNCELVGTFQWRGGGDVVLVGIGLVDIALRLAALIAIGFVIYGGISYVTSTGAPDKTKAAQETIINALIGLVIATISTAAISFIGRAISK